MSELARRLLKEARSPITALSQCQVPAEFGLHLDGSGAALSVSGWLEPSNVVGAAAAYQLLILLWSLCFVDAVVYATIASTITYWYACTCTPLAVTTS